MGAIFFYIFIYFVGYYGSNVLNMLTVRPFVTNRFIAALLPVYGVALTHAYVIVSSPPPQGSDMSIEYALLVFITLPVMVVTLGAMYFMWNSKGKPDDDSNESALDDTSKSTETFNEESSDQKIETPSEVNTVAEKKSDPNNVEHTHNSKEKT